jgi:hypothetical protein
MPKRGERVAPPARSGTWEVRYATSEAVRGWEELCRNAPNATEACWDRLRESPTKARSQRRQSRLKGPLGRRSIRGKELEQWQYEVTSAGRVFYCPDRDTHTVWLTNAGTGHPKQTE